MSAVTSEEVITIAARAFGVPREELLGWGEGGSRKPKLTWVRYARICAIALCLRHTSDSKNRVLCMFKGKNQGGRPGEQVGDQAARVLGEFNKYAPLRALIAKCEEKIDALHEQRTARHDRPIDERVVRDLASGALQ